MRPTPQPCVSVVIPTYNRAQLLLQALDSVLAQTFEDFELIVVDDGSTDDTASLVQGHGDSRIIYFPLEHTGNLSKVRNFGLRKAQGQYIAFLDSDDLWLPEKLRLQVDLLARHREVGLVICGYEIFNSEGVFFTNLYPSLVNQGEAPSTAWVFEPLLRLQMGLFPSAPLFRKSALGAQLLNEELRAGDHDFFVRLAFHWQAAILPVMLARIRRHEGCVSREWGTEAFEGVICSARHFFTAGDISRSIYKELLSSCYLGLAKLLLQSRDARSILSNFFGCLRIQPVLFRAWGLYARSYFRRPG